MIGKLSVNGMCCLHWHFKSNKRGCIMKFTMKFLSLLFSVLILTNIAHAESPREQLKRMVEQLQTRPNDDALREQIIKLAQTLKPAPAVPEEAERHMAYGTAAFTG